MDVTGLRANLEVKCPYTGKIFRIPTEKDLEQFKDKPQAKATPEKAKNQTNSTVESYVKDRPGFVASPFTKTLSLIDVRGREPGSVCVCPYTLQPFILSDKLVKIDKPVEVPAPKKTPKILKVEPTSEKAVNV